MSILVSGGAGYIGSHTCVELLNAGYEIVVADNYYNSCPEALKRVREITGKEFAFVEADMTCRDQVEAIFRAYPGIDCVIQFAAYKAVGESVAKPVMYYRNNLDATLTLLEVMAAHGVKCLLFSSSATVYTADNGKNALRKLKKHPVSLIISDWMMPEMDGPEFCRRVRENSEYSHLPFVMLTAKTDDAAKTESMNCGADVYIEKPFSMKYLEASVRQLLEMRRLLRSKFSHTPLEPIAEIAQTQVDNAFLERMSRIIEENVANPELNVAFLAEKMGMSRSSLFNKIRGLADVTPNEMILLVKLKKGAKLLKEGNYRISEISHMVGFSSPSYFAKCFQKQFGVKPMDFVAAES